MFKPNLQLPTQEGPEAYPQQTVQPPFMQYVINASQQYLDATADLNIIANGILEQNGALIQQYVTAKRQQYSQGAARYMRQQTTGDHLTVDYVNNYGQESIKITVYPDVSPGGGSIPQDLNYDGYLVWVQDWVPNDPANPAIKYDLIVNGYAVAPGITPPAADYASFTQQNGQVINGVQVTFNQCVSMVLVLFGTRALASHSLNDALSKFATSQLQLSNPPTAAQLANAAAVGPQGGLLNKIVPALAQVSANGPVPAHDNLPGYFCWSWGDPLNPDSWSYNSVINAGYGNWPAASYAKNFPTPTIIYCIQFKDSQNSPLNAKGQNLAYFRPSLAGSGATDTTKFPGYTYATWLSAEFYNRKITRSVNTSWSYQGDGSGQILVNDTPQIWMHASDRLATDIPNQDRLKLDFDLSVVQTPAYTSTLGFGQDEEDSSTPPESAVEVAINALNAATTATYYASYTPAEEAAGTAEGNLGTANAAIATANSTSSLGDSYNYANNPSPATLATAEATMTAAGLNSTSQSLILAYVVASVKVGASPFNTSANLAAWNAAASACVGDPADGIIGADYANKLCGIAASSYYRDGDPAAGSSFSGGFPYGNASTDLTDLNSAVAGLVAIATAAGQTALASAASAALTAFQNAMNTWIAVGPPPLLANSPIGAGQPLTNFPYRIITFVNGTPVYGPWLNDTTN